MFRHLIIEGPDGSGKSTLVTQLLESFPASFVPHAKASDSVGGPVPNLDEWAHHDVFSMPIARPSIYDRHPLVSEPIYGPIVRSGLPGKFNDHDWLKRMSDRCALYAGVIVCLPDFGTVLENTTQTEQMPGVTDRITDLYNAYQQFWCGWPGFVMAYDYTDPDSFIGLYRQVTHMLGSMKGRS